MNNDGAELVSQDLYGGKTAIKKKTPRLQKSTAIEKQGATGFFSSFSFSHFCHNFPRFISVEQTQLSLRLVQFFLLPPLKPEEAETQTDPG